MSNLFSPIKIGGIALNNRIVIPPMCQYSAGEGQANEWHLAHYGNLAMSGAGLMIIEATGVSPQGRISYGDLGLWDKNTAHTLSKVISFIRLHSDLRIGIQLSHAGRKASTDLGWKPHQYFQPDEPHGWQIYAPSAIPFGAHGSQILNKRGDKVHYYSICRSSETGTFHRHRHGGNTWCTWIPDTPIPFTDHKQTDR